MKLVSVTTALLLLFTMNLPASDSDATEKATLGGGCFWCVEAVYEGRPGVKSVVSGYAGGDVKDPTYKQVTSGQTGHAEVVQIEYDPEVVSYEEILDLFWKAHDPTTLNRQGADVGTQYRSIILYHDAAQKAAAEASREKAQETIDRPIVTEIAEMTEFYPAEGYHQDFAEQNPNHPYVKLVIEPKLRKLDK